MAKRVVLAVLVVLCSFGIAGAGWLSDAIDRTKKRAVDDAVDSTYDTTKEKLTVKSDDEESAPRQPARRPAQRPSKSGRDAVPAPQGDDDEHFIQPDDFFISDKPLGNHAWIHVRLAKVVTEPSPQTKGQGEFFRIHDGKNVWTKYFWRTRMANQGDIKLGNMVVMIDGRTEDGVYVPPQNKEEARSHAWFMAKITDTSDLYRNYVTVSGNYKVDLKSLRVLLKEGAVPQPPKPQPEEQDDDGGNRL